MKPNTDLEGNEIAFGVRDTAGLLPHYEEIPEPFKLADNPWCQFVRSWLEHKLDPNLARRLEALPEINRQRALNHILACLRSYQPSHSQKVAAGGYLMSLWFEPLPDVTEEAVRG